MDSQWCEGDSVQVILPSLLVTKILTNALPVQVFGGATIICKAFTRQLALSSDHIKTVIGTYHVTEEVQVRFM